MPVGKRRKQTSWDTNILRDFKQSKTKTQINKQQQTFYYGGFLLDKSFVLKNNLDSTQKGQVVVEARATQAQYLIVLFGVQFPKIIGIQLN